MKQYTVMGVAALAVLAGSASAQIFQESFESDPGTTYTLEDAFDDGGFDYFNRYLVPDNGNAARDDFQNGWHGSYGIQGQDHDGDGGDPTRSITMAGIDISGYSGMSMLISVAALNSEPDFQNFEASDGDGIKIYTNIDGAGDILLAEFAPPVSGAGDLYLDTDGDGIGDGTRLTIDLAVFSFSIAGTGNLMDIRIDATSTSSFESWAIDNVRLVPAPGALALLGIAGLASRRRR